MSPPGSVLVTGANGGLGTAIVARILSNPDVAANNFGLYIVRKPSTATSLQNALRSAPQPHAHEVVELDLSSIESVRKVAAELNRRVASGEIPPIRSLILNAGYQENTTISKTADGFETMWQVNYLANHLLVLLLLQSMDKKNGRILVVGSWSHDPADPRNATGGANPLSGKWADLFPGPDVLAKGEWSTPEDEQSWWGGYRRYGASKLCVTMLMHELAIRLGDDSALSGVRVIGLDPGGMGSGLLRRAPTALRLAGKLAIPLMGYVSSWFEANPTMRTMSKSGADVVRACYGIEAPEKGKLLYLNGTALYETSKDSQDKEKRQRLWTYGLQRGGVKQGDTVLQKWQ